ncbi:hypothetical protein [Streptomyces microflavus]|nr:hypothetical protein OH770_35575 [Streptomyces microflavus]
MAYRRAEPRYATVAIEDLNVRGMSASARGTVEQPGSMVRQNLL